MMRKSLIIPASLLLLASCAGKQEGWTLTGQLPDGVKTVTLELPSPAGGWYTADSVKIGENGFKITRNTANSEIYRLNIDGKYVYIPADSTETIALSIADGGNYVIAGSHEAELFNNVNAILDAPADSTTQRRLLVALQDDFASTAAYYANLRMNGRNRTLLRAVANAYSTARPDDPRTAILLNQLKKQQAGATATGETIVIEAPELGYFNIELLNRKGEPTSLSSTVDAHTLTLLAFVNFAEDDAPAVNLNIGEAFTAYPQIGVYEVGFGENQHQWAAASAELPWVNVFQSESASRTHLGQYAVSALPTFFLIKNGEIVERIADPNKIKETVGKYI